MTQQHDELQELLVTINLSDVEKAVDDALEIKLQLDTLKTTNNSQAEPGNPGNDGVISLLETNVQQLVDTLTAWKRHGVSQSGIVEQIDFDPLPPWKKLKTSGAFSTMYQGHYTGTKVAIKLLKKEVKLVESIAEGRLLKSLTHDHVVEFRGVGQTTIANQIDSDGELIPTGHHYLVMEFISSNLQRYVAKTSNPEKEGLPHSEVWNFGKQILSGLLYLHRHKPYPIAHLDLKPDNILLDEGQIHPRVKLADFGLSRPLICDNTKTNGGQIRWIAPELSPGQNVSSRMSNELLLKSDMFSYGLILLFLITGKKPWHHLEYLEYPYRGSTDSDSSSSLNILPDEERYEIPENVASELLAIITKCYVENPADRANSSQINDLYYKGRDNPFRVKDESGEFFSCGFLEDTKIFVADSRITESTHGTCYTNELPEGYQHSHLLCEVRVDTFKPGKAKPIVERPSDPDLGEKFQENQNEFLSWAREGKIDNNPAIALKSLCLPREGEEEDQKIVLEFAQTEYVIHRAMRKLWMETLTAAQQAEAVPAKGIVSQVYSNSFGLHVAVITADKPTPKFIFARRAKRKGLASPGNFTCGAVESCSVKDYIEEDGKTKVSLVRTAARGLNEELRVVLEGDDVDAITLSTVYLKYDTHEWGLCGFVDLNDERIRPDNRLAFEQLKSRFTTAGLKDKFEHEEVVAVDFTLSGMVQFVRENFRQFASSAKLVVVKVLQSFFGVVPVEQAFKMDTSLIDGTLDLQIQQVGVV